METPSNFLAWSFGLLGVLVAAALPLGLYWANRRIAQRSYAANRAALIATLGAVLWLGFTFAAAARGALNFNGTPPTMLLLIVAIIGVGCAIGFSRAGERLAMGLPLALLVGVQGFRLPLELLMHRAYEEGLMPVQMSYSGYNFDIVSGATALLVAALIAMGRMPLWAVRAWNWMGFILLVNVMTIANLSTPTPLRVFMNEPANVWVTTAPFVWLPAVMVLTALYGHIVLFRRLRAEASGRGRGEMPKSIRRSAAEV